VAAVDARQGVTEVESKVGRLLSKRKGGAMNKLFDLVDALTNGITKSCHSRGYFTLGNTVAVVKLNGKFRVANTPY
jgi:hypothetical protein